MTLSAREISALGSWAAAAVNGMDRERERREEGEGVREAKVRESEAAAAERKVGLCRDRFFFFGGDAIQTFLARLLFSPLQLAFISSLYAPDAHANAQSASAMREKEKRMVKWVIPEQFFRLSAARRPFVFLFRKK